MKNKTITGKLKGIRVKSTFVWLLAGVLAVLAGCDRSDGAGEEGSGDGKAVVRFAMGSIAYAGGGEMTRSGQAEERVTGQAAAGDGDLLLDYTLERVTEAQTRAAMADGTAVRVYAYDGDGYVKDAIIRVGEENDVMTLDAGTAYNIYAVSYNTTAAPGGETPSLGGGLLAVSAADDVLYTSDAIIPGAGNNDLTLNFRHAFSEITVEANTSAYTQEITACSAELTPVSNTADLSITTGELTATGSASSSTISWTSLGKPTRTSDAARVYTGGVAVGMGLSFTLEINDGTPATVSVGFDKALAGGSKYKLLVNFRKGGARQPDVQIGGVTWAKGNLLETNAPGVYAMYNEEWEHGNIYQSGAYWNWGAMHPRTNYTAFWSDSDGGPTGTGATADNAKDWRMQDNDPCSAYTAQGTPPGTYRLPTSAELLKIKDLYVVGTYSATNPTKGLWYGTNSLTTAQQNPDNYIFLPAGGERYVGGNVISSTMIRYWSSNHHYYVKLFLGGGWDTSAGFPAIGPNVRCVRD